MFQWPNGYVVCLWHMRLLVQIQLATDYYLMDFFVTSKSQWTCYPLHHMLANIQRSLTVTGNKRIHQIIYCFQLVMKQKPHVPHADTITTRPLKHFVSPDFLPINIVNMITNASVYCGSEFDSPREHFWNLNYNCFSTLEC